MGDVAGRGKPTLEEFHTAMKTAGVGALWEVQAAEAANPPPPERPMHWRWRDMQTLIDMTASVVDTEQAERRVLMLQNPAYGHTGRGGPATPNLTANFQILLPGEKARPHRHTIHALRFVMEGSGATTYVDGKACPMEPGDMILTPAWTWHEHAHEGTERMVWFDGLDAPLRRHLAQADFEPGPVHDLPDTANDAAFDAVGLVPDGAPAPKDYSPVFRYPWKAARAALDHVPLSRDGARTLRYVNPATGGPAMSLLDCFLIKLTQGANTRPMRTSSNAVFIAAEGAGRSTIGETTVTWEKNDVFTMPRNHWTSHTATSKDAVVFAMTDRDLMARLGLLTDELKDA